jgi:hypothetical protein
MVLGVPIFYTGICHVLLLSEHVGVAAVTSQFVARRTLPGKIESKLKAYYYRQYGWRMALVVLVIVLVILTELGEI